MAVDIDQGTAEFIRSRRVARLATVNNEHKPAVVPICYVFDGEFIYTPIDEKPKSVDAASLKRVRNILSNPSVAIVVDEYSDEWQELLYVLISGAAEIITPKESDSEHAFAVSLLREKYPQYLSMNLDDRPIIKITPARIKRWSARDS